MTDLAPLSDAELDRVIHDHEPKFAYESAKVDELTKVCHACRPRHNEMLTLAPCLVYRLAVEMKAMKTLIAKIVTDPDNGQNHYVDIEEGIIDSGYNFTKAEQRILKAGIPLGRCVCGKAHCGGPPDHQAH